MKIMKLNFMSKEYSDKFLDKLNGNTYNSKLLTALCDDVNVLVGNNISSCGLNSSLKFIMRTTKGNLILNNSKGESVFNNEVEGTSCTSLNDFVIYSCMVFVKSVFLEDSSPVKMSMRTYLTPFGIIKKENEIEMIIQIIFDNQTYSSGTNDLQLKDEYRFNDIKSCNIEPLVKKSIKFTKE